MAEYNWIGDEFVPPEDMGSLDAVANYRIRLSGGGDGDMPEQVPGVGDTVYYIGEVPFPPSSGTSHADWVFEAWPVYGGTYNGNVTNQGIIHDGTFNGPVENSGDIYGGTFNGYVESTSMGTILGGIFNGHVENDGAITGGTFNDRVDNYGALEGGPITINGYLRNHNSWCELSGTTFGPAASFRLGSSSRLYGPEHEDVADPSDVRAGVINLGVPGTLVVPTGGGGILGTLIGSLHAPVA